MALITATPAFIPMLVGGAIGGALPDIDIEGSAVEKLGGKTASFMDKTVGKAGGFGKQVAKLFAAVGVTVDMMILKPIAKFWRFLAKNLFGRVYLWLYNLGSFGKEHKTLGQKLHWMDDQKPWKHRGGITHSFSFMLTSSIFLFPLSLLVGGMPFYIGCMLGILSHLVADSFCKSGVKFFFPWQPKIGFKNDSGKGRGDDIRLLPPRLQVSTGKDRITNDELDRYHDQEEARRDRKLRFREKLWQKLFQLGAFACIIACVFLFFTNPQPAESANQNAEGADIAQFQNGGFSNSANGGNPNSAAAPDNQQQSQQGSQQSSSVQTTQNDAPVNSVGNMRLFDGASESSRLTPRDAVAQLQGSIPFFMPEAGSILHVPEYAASKSLTNKDYRIEDLPIGVYKMPDESLYVIGVGRLTKEVIDSNPRWNWSQADKIKLYEMVGASGGMLLRTSDMPNSVDEWKRLQQQAAEAAQKAAAEQQSQQNQNTNDSGSGSDNGLIGGILGALGWGNSSDSQSGYESWMGITPFTQD